MSDDDVSRYRANWRDEVESAALYRTLAEVEAGEAALPRAHRNQQTQPPGSAQP